MRIKPIALWTDDLERSKRFYVDYFGAAAGAHYVNAAKGFESCFLSFAGGARIEIMKTTALSPVAIERGAQRMGLTHFADSVGSASAVDELTRRLCADGYPVFDVLSVREFGWLCHATGVERLVRNSLWAGRVPGRFYDSLEWLYAWRPERCLEATS